MLTKFKLFEAETERVRWYRGGRLEPYVEPICQHKWVLKNKVVMERGFKKILHYVACDLCGKMKGED